MPHCRACCTVINWNSRFLVAKGYETTSDNREGGPSTNLLLRVLRDKISKKPALNQTHGRKWSKHVVSLHRRQYRFELYHLSGNRHPYQSIDHSHSYLIVILYTDCRYRSFGCWLLYHIILCLVDSLLVILKTPFFQGIPKIKIFPKFRKRKNQAVVEQKVNSASGNSRSQ